MSITAQSIKNSWWQRREMKRFGRAIEGVALHPPIFILGHWRSGTTHLHNLMAQDRRFGFPTTFQTSFPHRFLLTEEREGKLLARFIPRQRPMDAMEMNLALPQEDEFALCPLTLMSPCLGWVFPRERAKFDRFLAFQGVDERAVASWRAGLQFFLKKVQLKCGRPLILKSPPHTARLRLLLEAFPGAKFIHIHRNPYAVFQSSRHLFETIVDWHRLQRAHLDDLDDWILRQHKSMYAAFFGQRSSIPAGDFHEIGFEQLEADPIRELRAAYERLGLPDFAEAEPCVRNYLSSIAGYKKNVFAELDSALKQRVRSEWSDYFEAWDYAA